MAYVTTVKDGREWVDKASFDEKRDQLATLQATLAERERKCSDYRKRKDEAYSERNKVVAALAKLFPSGIARTNIEGWDEEWHGCVYIDLPWGQVSWHYHDSQADLFKDLPPYTKPWDGHDTDEKYHRLSMLKPTDLDAARQDAARLREALRFYADPHSYGLNGGSNERIIKDRGQQAQRALKGA